MAMERVPNSRVIHAFQPGILIRDVPTDAPNETGYSSLSPSNRVSGVPNATTDGDVYGQIRERFVSTSIDLYPMSRYHHGCYGETGTNCSQSKENQFLVLSLLSRRNRVRPSPL